MKTKIICVMIIFICLPNSVYSEIDYLKTIKQVKAEHPDWPTDVCENVAMGKVTNGMTPDQVIASWGKPIKTYNKLGEKGRYDYWHYKKVVVVFKDKKVIKINIKERKN